MEPPSLPVRIHARRTGASPVWRDGCLELRGELDWRIEGHSTLLDDLQAALGSTAERLAAELLLVDFGNSVGCLQLPHLGKVEVVSGKWNGTHFEWMLQDLMQVASALPFTADAATALPYDRSIASREHVLYHAFVYLRHILSEEAPRAEQLLPALAQLLRDPHRQFTRCTHPVPLESATRIDAGGLLAAVSGPGPFIRVESPIQQRVPLAKALDGYLPAELRQREARSTFDTAENRFVKSFLRLAQGTVSGIRRYLGKRRDTAFTRRIAADCDWMERLLVPIQSHSLWNEVGPMIHVPASSSVLQRRVGYREVFGHFNRLRLSSRVPLSMETVWKLLEVKDIAALYELWCYFSVVRAVEDVLGPPLQADGVRNDELQLSVPWEFHVRWKNGTHAFYNPRFSRSAGALRSSYSVPLRPDIGVQLPDYTFHLFDAKFRLDRLDSVFITPHDLDDEDQVEVEEERRGTFKRGDLYKMHTYRDAISGARSVWILYPGSEARFYGTNGTDLQPAEGYVHDVLDGVGALPLVPNGRVVSPLAAVLRSLVYGPTR